MLEDDVVVVGELVVGVGVGVAEADDGDEEDGGAGCWAGLGTLPLIMVTLNETPVSPAIVPPYFGRRDPDGTLKGAQPSRTVVKESMHAGLVISVESAQEDCQFIDSIKSKIALLLPSYVLVVLRFQFW